MSLTDIPIISADSHMIEPPEMWSERVATQYRDRAPKLVRGLNGRDAEFFTCENIHPFPVAGFFGAGVRSRELGEHARKGFDDAPACARDPQARLADQDRDGVVAEVLYTSMGMPLYHLDDAGLRAALFRAYNDWLAEYCADAPERLIGQGLITMEDIPAAVAELTRIAGKGLRGAMIWAGTPDERPYSHADYDPFWAAAADLQMPLSLHILTGRKGSGIDFNQAVLSAVTLHHEIQETLAIMALGGVFERHPGLRIVSAENDVGWIPHFMNRVDMCYKRLRFTDRSLPELGALPSEQMTRQVFATFVNEPVAMGMMDWYGPDNIMWSSDYPHTASTWPRSHELMEKMFDGLSDEAVRKVTHDTVCNVYRIPA